MPMHVEDGTRYHDSTRGPAQAQSHTYNRCMSRLVRVSPGHSKLLQHILVIFLIAASLGPGSGNDKKGQA